MKTYLRRLYASETIFIGATDATETLAGANEVFEWFVDPDGFDIHGQQLATPPTVVVVNELIEDGTFTEILGSLGEDRSKWQQSQVVMFCRHHRDKLRLFGFSSFFELEGGLVVNVLLLGEKLGFVVNEVVCNDTWSAGTRPRFMILKTARRGGASPLTNKPHIIVYGCFSF
jgi:hypothetical protein